MVPGARLSAAMEILADIASKRRPASDALKDWGLSHRFAGSSDRAALAGIVYDALRRKASSAFIMGEDSERAIVLGMLKRERGLAADAIARLADGSRFAPSPLTDLERLRLETTILENAPPHIVGDYPEWLDAQLAAVFGESRAEEGAALASRAPLDLRVNGLKADRDEATAEIAHLHPEPTPWSPFGLRIIVAAEARSPAIHAEPAFLKGQIEIQDEGSQLASLFADAKPGEQVIDLCAGAGGKTMALAAMMENTGQIFATDPDIRRLAPIHARLERAGVRNVQVRTPKPKRDMVSNLSSRADLVLVDAPCTGSGSWRRNPDAKWRVRPGALDQRVKDQAEILDRAATLVKPGGRIAYVTCSVLDAENGAQIRGFRSRYVEFEVTPPSDIVKVLGDKQAVFASVALLSAEGVLMTPRRTGTDGFFVAILKRG